MTEYKTENKIGVGEILICNKDTNGKLEPLKYFIGKVIINIGGGGEKLYVIEEKEKISSEVKSIQSRINFNKNNIQNMNESALIENLVNHNNKENNNSTITIINNNNNSMISDTILKNQKILNNLNKENHIESNEIDMDLNVELQRTNSQMSFRKSITKEFEEGIKTNMINNNLHDIKELDEKEIEDLTNSQIINPRDNDINNNLEMNINKDRVQEGYKKLSKNLGDHLQDENNEHKEDEHNNMESGNISPIANNRHKIEYKLKNNLSNQNLEKIHSDDLNHSPLDGGLENELLQHSNRERKLNKENLIKDANSQISVNTKYTNDFMPNKNVGFTDRESQIIQIVKGKHHLLKLTMDGKVYGSGYSYFGVVGLGGSHSSEKSILIPNLAKIKIVQISCGMFHSLALSLNGDLYAWGMGFEGQLGLTATYKVASSPRYVSFFYKKPVKFITCGHNYSLCITNDSRLWGWGENKLGQLGLGKIQIVDKPTHIKLLDLSGNQEGINKVDNILSGVYERPYTGNHLNACYISAGFAHTAVVTDEGFLLTFGLNIYGQLGLGNTVSTFEPKLIDKDINGEYIGSIVKVCCNVSGTFIITEDGRLFTSGSGEIGHGDAGLIKLPKLISDNRVYKHVFCNENSVLAFCPLRILSISPNCGPSSGNTILSIIGSALKEFPKLSVRFIFGGVAWDVKATFDKISRTISVRTPNFIELCPTLELPSTSKVQLTFDGHYFTEYEDSFLIYPSNIKLTGIEPKCGPTIGGSQIQIKINLDGINSKFLFSLTCGFQAKPIAIDPIQKFKTKTKAKLNNSSFNTAIVRTHEDLETSKISQDETGRDNQMGTTSHNKENTSYINGNPTSNTNINPMDFANIDSQLDKANWYCCFATYEHGIMYCNIPKIQNFNQNQVEYNVDVAINGQQFTGYPMIYRFYDIKVEKMEPNISSLEGGLLIKIFGTGLFDSLTKKAKISSSLGERYSDLQWDRNDKALILNSNPLHWITNDEDVIKNISPSDLFENYSFDVHITMNNIEWIYAGAYRYCDPKATRVIYHSFPETMSKEDRLIYLSTQEFLTNDEKIILGLVPMPDDKKKKEEIEKKKAEEDNTINTVYRRPYTGLAVYGNFFPNTHLLKIKFISQNSEVDAIAFYKNKYKIMCLIPEMHKLTSGQNELKLMISVNSQQYFPGNKTILFNQPEFGLKFEDIIKLDDLEAKGGKKGVAGKPVKK